MPATDVRPARGRALARAAGLTAALATFGCGSVQNLNPEPAPPPAVEDSRLLRMEPPARGVVASKPSREYDIVEGRRVNVPWYHLCVAPDPDEWGTVRCFPVDRDVWDDYMIGSPWVAR